MKKLYAITSKGKNLKSLLDVRFGRCESIVVFDPVSREHAILDNQFKEDAHAGIKLVEFLKKNNITTIITGEVGPMAQEKLKENKTQIVLLEEDRIKIEEVISKIKAPR